MAPKLERLYGNQCFEIPGRKSWILLVAYSVQLKLEQSCERRDSNSFPWVSVQPLGAYSVQLKLERLYERRDWNFCP